MIYLLGKLYRWFPKPLVEHITWTNKVMSMTMKYHNHTPQTNPRHREEEPWNTNSHKTSDRQSKATSSLFLIKMILGSNDVIWLH